MFENSRIRVDVDDREERTTRKIRTAEREWIPFIIVVGDKELDADMYPVRRRSTRTVEQMSDKSIIEILRKETAKVPFLPLPKPMHYLTTRPTFIEGK